jgi:7-carboxy-7-deazaguanine synthase
MKINEIFYSLQGEGARVGQPTVFIRLTGCDLSCGFCDTEFVSGKEITTDELLARVKQYPAKWITWTGGEPMLQLNEGVVSAFRDAGYLQSIETNGGHPVPFDLDWVVVSPKVAEHVVKRNFPDGVDELRYAWHAGKMSVPQPGAHAVHKFLSPVCDGNSINATNLKHCIELCKSYPEWKLSVQQHKIWNIL